MGGDSTRVTDEGLGMVPGSQARPELGRIESRCHGVSVLRYQCSRGAPPEYTAQALLVQPLADKETHHEVVVESRRDTTSSRDASYFGIVRYTKIGWFSAKRLFLASFGRRLLFVARTGSWKPGTCKLETASANKLAQRRVP
jgi:hypothetical protein